MTEHSFRKYILFKEGMENFDQPHVISADPPMKLPTEIERLAEAFKKAKEVSIGKEVDSARGGEKDITLKARKLFVVGDAVSAYLMGRTPRSFSLVTDAHPEEVVKICRKAVPPIDILKIDKAKGVVKVSVNDKTYEIETMKDGSAGAEGGLPFTTDVKKDSSRRDMTANSLYYEVSTKKIFDYTGGARHIKEGDVKFVGNPDDKISKDGMNKFKYAYMVNKMPNGKIDPGIKELIRSKKGQELPTERVREEFWGGMEDLHVDAKKYIKTYEDLDLLDVVFPGLKLNLDFPDCKTCKTRAVALASLLKENEPESLVQKLRKLHYTDREIKDAVFLINLTRYQHEYATVFKKELIKTSLTRRQIMDWCKVNDLDEESIAEMMDKPLNHSFAGGN